MPNRCGSEPCGADAGLVTAQELGSFIDEINDAFPSLRLGLEDITLVQRGIVPAKVNRGTVTLADRPLVREHRQDHVARCEPNPGTDMQEDACHPKPQVNHLRSDRPSAYRHNPGAKSKVGLSRQAPPCEPSHPVARRPIR